MKGQLVVSTPEEYIASLDEPRRSEVARTDALISETVPDLERVIQAGMIGYGPFHYKYASGHEGDTSRIVLASNKQYISIYTCASDAAGYFVERYADRLPKAKIGRGCIRFKHLDDLDQGVLREIFRACAGASL
jgi:hypothetical protein